MEDLSVQVDGVSGFLIDRRNFIVICPLSVALPSGESSHTYYNDPGRKYLVRGISTVGKPVKSVLSRVCESAEVCFLEVEEGREYFSLGKQEVEVYDPYLVQVGVKLVAHGYARDRSPVAKRCSVSNMPFFSEKRLGSQVTSVDFLLSRPYMFEVDVEMPVGSVVALESPHQSNAKMVGMFLEKNRVVHFKTLAVQYELFKSSVGLRTKELNPAFYWFPGTKVFLNMNSIDSSHQGIFVLHSRGHASLEQKFVRTIKVKRAEFIIMRDGCVFLNGELRSLDELFWVLSPKDELQIDGEHVKFQSCEPCCRRFLFPGKDSFSRSGFGLRYLTLEESAKHFNPKLLPSKMGKMEEDHLLIESVPDPEGLPGLEGEAVLSVNGKPPNPSLLRGGGSMILKTARGVTVLLE